MEKSNEDSVSRNESTSESVATEIHQNGTVDTVEAKPEDDAGNNCNPDKMPEELKDIFLVDAIGDTLYSKRFVLKTLLDLNKVESKLSEEFEKDLCTLWDMTIERDVIKLLLEHNVLELFSSLIQVSEDQRLVEILLGIIANMCSLSQTREGLCQQPDVMIPIIDLISCSDTLILMQLMRLFHTCLVFENSGDEYIWFQHFRCAHQFVDKFAFLLSNSMSTSLLVHAYEALNAICTKFAVIEIQPEIADSSGFRDVFVKPALVSGVIEAFKQMLPDVPKAADTSGDGENSQSNSQQQIIEDDISAPSKRTQRIMNLFLDINVILSQYDSASRKCYEPFLPELMKCISKCLQALCYPVYLLPLSSSEQILIENVNELIQALDDPFHEKCFQQMITIWSLIEEHLAKVANKSQSIEPKSEWDAEDNCDNDDEEVSGMDINMTILEYVTRTSKNANLEQITSCIKTINQDIIVALCKALSPGNAEEDIRSCSDKFKEAARMLWDIEITINEDEFDRRSVSDVDDEDDENYDDDGDANVNRTPDKSSEINQIEPQTTNSNSNSTANETADEQPAND